MSDAAEDPVVGDVLAWQRANARRARLAASQDTRPKVKDPKRCHYCLRPGGTRDHVVPRSLLRQLFLVRAGSGPQWPPNIVPCCERCNQLKGDKRSDCTCELCEVAWNTYGPTHRAWPEVVPVMTLAALANEEPYPPGWPG